MRFWRRQHREQELNRELQDHLNLEADEQRAAGVPPREAQYAAQRAIGNMAHIQEAVRDVWGWTWLERINQDLRLAVRMLRLNPGFASVAVLALGLGIGANTALYSILNAVFLRLLPVAKPEQLVVLAHRNTSFSYPLYRELRDKSKSLQDVIAYRTLQANIGLNGVTERVKAVLVSGNYFSGLGVRMALGAPIAPEDDTTPGSGGSRGPVAVLSYSFWQRRFNADPKAVGSRIDLNGMPLIIVGIVEAGFSGTEIGEAPVVFAPMMMQPALLPYDPQALSQPRNVWLRILGRLGEGVSRAQAEAELTIVMQQFWRQYAPELSAARLRTLLDQRVTLTAGGAGTSPLRRRYSQPLTILLVVAGLVLLIACANVANLLLTRATGRQREIAVRLALGATRRRLISQLLTESLLLSLIGSAAGLLFARWGRDLVLRFLPQAADVQVTLDGPVLGFSLLLGLSAGLLFGLAPALQATRPDMTPVLKDDNLSGGPKRFNLRRGLVVVQVALSLMLLSGAGVFLRSLRNLEQLDPGFVRENVLVFSLDPRLKGYTAVEARLLFDRLIERLKLLPGVRAAGVADFAPLGMHTGNTIYVEGYQPRADEPRSDPGVGLVSPDYFATMGIPVIFGREFSARDSAAAPKVAIVNQTFARHYFGNQNPLGKRLGYRDGIFDMEVVGVVRDSKYGGLREEATRMLYLAAAQRPYGGGVVHVRTAGDAEVLGPLARAEVRALDRDLPVNDLTTVRLELDRALTQDRLVAALSTLFSALALVLSAVGLYGVMSYAVSRRTREIGIRMALGAERGNIARQVLQEVAMLMLAGVLLGLPAAYAVLKLVSGMLFGLSSTDTATTVLAVAVLGLAALIAAWLPARRAARVDPMVALRYVG